MHPRTNQWPDGYAALSGLGMLRACYPGRCPGLECGRPFGPSEHGPRPLDKTEKDIDRLEKEIMVMLKEVTA